MGNTNLYNCLFDVTGGYSGEVDDTLEVEFELTDEEYQQTLKILDENDHTFSDGLPFTMHETIWAAAWEHVSALTSKLAEEYPDEYSEDDIFELSSENIFNINDPEPIA